MIAANAQDLKLVKEGGENYLTVRRYGGPDKHTLKVLFPTANPSYEKPNVILKGGGMVSVVASYPDAHAMDFRWDNTPQGVEGKALSRMKDGE
ncbi:MAG: hypothetical protein FJX77_09580 [Armatimonadetes bacterium]|nr:hypothetical protein [Armatimonadota bacterium]